MKFDGIGCLRKEGNDTVFYISCHIDRNKINRIINHSKFELALDTLIICPTRSNLPNSVLNIPFHWRKKEFLLFYDNEVDFFLDEWNRTVTKDQELGQFSLEIPVDSSQLDRNGFFRYIRKDNEVAKYKSEAKVYRSSLLHGFPWWKWRIQNQLRYWGIQTIHRVERNLRRYRPIPEELERRPEAQKKLEPSEDIMTRSWQVVSSQQWNELTKQWVITTLKAPADIITQDVIDKLGLEAETSY